MLPIFLLSQCDHIVNGRTGFVHSKVGSAAGFCKSCLKGTHQRNRDGKQTGNRVSAGRVRGACGARAGCVRGACGARVQTADGRLRVGGSAAGWPRRRGGPGTPGGGWWHSHPAELSPCAGVGSRSCSRPGSPCDYVSRLSPVRAPGPTGPGQAALPGPAFMTSAQY